MSDTLYSFDSQTGAILGNRLSAFIVNEGITTREAHRSLVETLRHMKNAYLRNNSNGRLDHYDSDETCSFAEKAYRELEGKTYLRPLDTVPRERIEKGIARIVVSMMNRKKSRHQVPLNRTVSGRRKPTVSKAKAPPLKRQRTSPALPCPRPQINNEEGEGDYTAKSKKLYTSTSLIDSVAPHMTQGLNHSEFRQQVKDLLGENSRWRLWPKCVIMRFILCNDLYPLHGSKTARAHLLDIFNNLGALEGPNALTVPEETALRKKITERIKNTRFELRKSSLIVEVEGSNPASLRKCPEFDQAWQAKKSEWEKSGISIPGLETMDNIDTPPVEMPTNNSHPLKRQKVYKSSKKHTVGRGAAKAEKRRRILMTPQTSNHLLGAKPLRPRTQIVSYAVPTYDFDISEDEQEDSSYVEDHIQEEQGSGSTSPQRQGEAHTINSLANRPDPSTLVADSDDDCVEIERPRYIVRLKKPSRPVELGPDVLTSASCSEATLDHERTRNESSTQGSEVRNHRTTSTAFHTHDTDAFGSMDHDTCDVSVTTHSEKRLEEQREPSTPRDVYESEEEGNMNVRLYILKQCGEQGWKELPLHHVSVLDCSVSEFFKWLSQQYKVKNNSRLDFQLPDMKPILSLTGLKSFEDDRFSKLKSEIENGFDDFVKIHGPHREFRIAMRIYE